MGLPSDTQVIFGKRNSCSVLKRKFIDIVKIILNRNEKISAIKFVRDITKMGLAESKEFVETPAQMEDFAMGDFKTPKFRVTLVEEHPDFPKN